MARQKKEGTYINVKIRQDIYDEFVKCCEREDRTKTAVLERMMKYYLDGQKRDNINSRGKRLTDL